MKAGDKVIYKWIRYDSTREPGGNRRGTEYNYAERTIVSVGPKSARVEFARGGQSVCQTVQLSKLTLKEASA